MPKSSLPPRPGGLPVLGNAYRLLTDPLGFPLDCARRYGDVVDLNIPLTPTILISHPDLIEEALVQKHRSYIKDRWTRDLSVLLGSGLLTSDGELWRRQRRLVQPAFHRERIASYGETMVRYTERLAASWTPGEERDIHDDMMRLTREIVAKTLFDADLADDARDVDTALQIVMDRFADIPPGFPVLSNLPTAGKRRFERAVSWLDGFIRQLIDERRASDRDPGDLLSMMMAATDEEGGGRMTDQQLRDEVMTLFLAGHETTANTLSWTWVLLARNPPARAALEAELDEVLAGRAPTLEDIPRLRYADQVIRESMRLFPPAWAIGREATTDTSIGGYPVPRGTSLWISQYVVHRDPRYFDEPEAFRPERWADDLAKRLPRYAYFPFGGGPRVCIGNTFATLEAVLLLATLAQRFRLDLVPGHRIEPFASITLRPRRGVRARIQPRR